ncbi:HAT and Suf domain-containing protein [Phanerochaete sordida]|uniref:mRNA 3'-end-processing protein RNA14 n=1 Tax=Phanerochaete sordida TaxID=48140 RepID=A0A9P3LGZ4_9APHY|nr:HAT and Suf domain-containing protein [Phanerochaete sordida]
MSQESQANTSSSQTQSSEYEVLQAQVRENPRDVDAWLKLVDVAEESKDFERINQTYEALLEAFPNSSSAQIPYIRHILESSSPTKYQYAEGLFKRSLKTSPFVDLWKYYLRYVQQMNTAPTNKDTVRKAYEFALNHIGHDKESGSIWSDYIQFLKDLEAATPWEEGQKNDAIRKAYQRVVQIPTDNVKRLWEEWQEWENGLNKITAKKLISDATPAHMQARTVLNALQEHLTVLFPPAPPSKHRNAIVLPRVPTFASGEKALVARWRAYLKWEESNPLEIEEKDKAQLHSRLQSVYRKAIVRMRFYPEIWFMAYVWTMSLSEDQTLPEAKRKEKKDEALNILKAGSEANPTSFLLNFAYVELQEANNNIEEVHTTFDKFFAGLRKNLDAVEARLAAKASQSQSQSQPSEQSQQPPTPVGAEDAFVPAPSSQQTNGGEIKDAKPAKDQELRDRRTEYGVAWIVYMRFARRAEGVKSARTVFGKSRKDRWTPWEVYEAAALMEYHCTKAADVAGRIFERGMETFPDEVELALRYLGFLITINDDANARALFERAVNNFPAEKARSIWDRWARYEYQYGTLEACHLLEKRMAEVYPQDPPIKRFAERHKYLGCDAIAVRDLGFTFGGRGNGSANKTEVQPTASPGTQQSQPVPQTPAKRPSSPDHRRRDESRSSSDYPPSKRQRPVSPARGHDRDRWGDGARGRGGRYASPSPWDREREREGPPGRRYDNKERDEDKNVSVPPVVSWFLGMLPAPGSFDGPVFRNDDLMQVFRGAVIPSSTPGGRPRSPPPPPRGGGRPPPDYSPYTGPGGGRRGRY